MTTKFPSSVTVNDDDPQKGYITIFLETPGLKVKKALIGKAKAENAEVTVDMKGGHEGSLAVVINIQGGVCFEYKKKLPADVEPTKSSHEMKKDAVVLKLKKKEAESWSAHVRYLMSRE